MRILVFGRANTGQLGVNDHPHDHYDKPVIVEGNAWKKVKCGGYHTVALTVQGQVFAWGAGWNGQLGLGKNVQKQFVPRPVSVLEEGTVVSKIACGISHTVVITTDRRVLSWGGESGDFGLRTVSGFPNGVIMKSVAAGNTFTVAISVDGQVFSWGSGLDGRLGVGNTRNFRNPQKVTIPPASGNSAKVIRIAAGKAHTLALVESGQLFSWGCGTKGQLGHGNEDDQFNPTLIAKLQGVTRIAAGEAHSVALTTKGEVYAWGDGANGQLGQPKAIQNNPELAAIPDEVVIVRIAAGQLHTIALSEYGDVFSWGNNSFGQLGVGNSENTNSPTYLDSLPDNLYVAKAAGGESHTILLAADFNRFDRANFSKYKASIQPPPTPASSTNIATQPGSGKAGRRKSARRSVKFNLDAAFAEMEGDLLALEAEEEGDDSGEEDSDDQQAINGNNNSYNNNSGGEQSPPSSPQMKKGGSSSDLTSKPQTEGDAILHAKKEARNCCGCIII